MFLVMGNSFPGCHKKNDLTMIFLVHSNVYLLQQRRLHKEYENFAYICKVTLDLIVNLKKIMLAKIS